LDVYEEALSGLEARDEGLLQDLIKAHDEKPVSKEPELKLKATRAKRSAVANFEVTAMVMQHAFCFHVLLILDFIERIKSACGKSLPPSISICICLLPGSVSGAPRRSRSRPRCALGRPRHAFLHFAGLVA